MKRSVVPAGSTLIISSMSLTSPLMSTATFHQIISRVTTALKGAPFASADVTLYSKITGK
jgi:hypothetical protein